MNGTLFFREIRILNEGNAQDNFTLTILNGEDLLSNGWEVKINGKDDMRVTTGDIQPGLADVANVTMKAVRSVPSGNISVAILVVSNNSAAASAVVYATPVLPDLHLQESTPIIGDSIYDSNIFAERDAENLALLAVMFALLASIFIIRKIKFGRFFR